MSIFEKPRWAIFNQTQHPFRHSLADFSYTNARLPQAFNANVELALDYIIATLYPNYIGTYATPAALPGVANPNDYAFVTDDGDGKSAGYVFLSVDGVSQWCKRYDVDWSLEGILSETINRTKYEYVQKNGFDQLDAAGVAVVGTYAGQTIFGGASTNTNLTLNANSADATGYVQTDNIFRPTGDNTIDLGTNALKWKTGYFGTSAIVGTLTVAPASITDSSGAISFDNEDLSTTGNIDAGTLDVATTADIAGFVIQDIAGPKGQITHSSGEIDFSNENLATTGSVTASSGIFGTLTVTSGSITDSGGAIDFDDENLQTTGTLQAGDTTVTKLSADNVDVDGNAISVTNLNGSLTISANGTGIVDVTSTLTTDDIDAVGTVDITGQLNTDNVRIDGNTISTTDVNGSLTLTPNGTGSIVVSSSVVPSADDAKDLGTLASRYQKLFLSDAISDGTTEISQATLQSLRDINSGVAVGMTIFWDGSKWAASAPDTEVDHGSISGLGDDDHIQYALLAGRAGSQVLVGGTGAGETLTLESTAHATKGSVFTSSSFKPTTDATYAGGWQGVDLGGSSNYFRDIYSKGEHKGLRIENFTSLTLPAASAQNTGRIVWATDELKLYVDLGGAFAPVSMNKFLSDTAWNGSDTTKDVTVSSTIVDARKAIWALHDNSNDFERIYTSIKAISATQVRITVSPALPAGSYRLIGLE